MKRKIIHIDEEKCNGCGLCARACHEGAIDIVDGKAKLVRENFCDGFGDCLPACPTGAISFEEREAPAYDEAAVKASQNKKNAEKCNMTDHEKAMMAEMSAHTAGHGCSGSRFMHLNREPVDENHTASIRGNNHVPVSRLGQWPCQIKLMPTKAPFYDGGKLLIAADCTAYAYANMHEEFMRGKITVGRYRLYRETNRDNIRKRY